MSYRRIEPAESWNFGNCRPGAHLNPNSEVELTSTTGARPWGRFNAHPGCTLRPSKTMQALKRR